MKTIGAVRSARSSRAEMTPQRKIVAAMTSTTVSLIIDLPPRTGSYCRAMATRSSLSLSWISSPERSTVTVCSVPVNRNGAA